MLIRDTEPWTALAAAARLRQPRVAQSGVANAPSGAPARHALRLLDRRRRDGDGAAASLGVEPGNGSPPRRPIAALIDHDADRARESGAQWQPIVLLRNRAARQRSGVARIEIEEFLAHVPVGPGSAPESATQTGVLSRAMPRVPSLGKLQVLSRDVRYSRTESPRHYPDNDLVAVSQVLAWVDDAPPYGIDAHAIGDGKARRTTYAARTCPRRRKEMSNGLLDVMIADGGAITLRTAGRCSRDHRSHFILGRSRRRRSLHAGSAGAELRRSLHRHASSPSWTVAR